MELLRNKTKIAFQYNKSMYDIDWTSKMYIHWTYEGLWNMETTNMSCIWPHVVTLVYLLQAKHTQQFVVKSWVYKINNGDLSTMWLVTKYVLDCNHWGGYGATIILDYENFMKRKKRFAENVMRDMERSEFVLCLGLGCTRSFSRVMCASKGKYLL